MNKKVYIILTSFIVLFALIFLNYTTLKEDFIKPLVLKFYVEKFRDGPAVDADHLITKLDNGMPIIVNKHDRCVCWRVRLTGYWDFNETKVLKDLVKKDFKIVEVGANFGVHTLRMAELVGKNGKIYAVEANPNVSKYLKKTVELNQLTDRIFVFENAASDKNYDGFMVYNLSNIGGGYILPDNQESRDCCKNSLCTPIYVKTLDEMMPQSTHVDMLKIDAEGAEFFILQGATSILKQPQLVLMMEHSLNHIERNKIKLSQFIDFLKKYGFQYIWSVGKGGVLTSITYGDLYKQETLDIVLAKTPL